MRHDVGSDQEFLRDTTARFLAQKVPSSVVRELRHDAAGFHADHWRQGAALGWTSLLVSETDGGGSVSGDGLADLSLIAHEFGRVAAPGPLLPNAIVAGALSRAGGHGDTLAGLLTGDGLATWAMEEGPPHDLFDPPMLEIIDDGDTLVLRGTKRPVESAAQATHLLVSGRTGDGRSQVLVPTSAPGIAQTPLTSVDLTRRFSVVHFDDVRVPASAVVGTIGEAGEDIDRQLLWALCIANAESVGALQTAFDMTLEWTSDRYSFGRPLAAYQAIKHRMADMKSWLEASHAIADDALVAVSSGAPDAVKLTSAAKAFISTHGSELLQECVQLHGGIGVTFEHDLHLTFRRHTLNRGLLGSPAEHHRRVGQLLVPEAV